VIRAPLFNDGGRMRTGGAPQFQRLCGRAGFEALCDCRASTCAFEPLNPAWQHDRRIGNPVEINLANESRKGARMVGMSTVLPLSWTDEILEHGIEATRDRLNSPTPAASRELTRAVYELLRREKTMEAIEDFRVGNELLRPAAS
jgi:hypothetical protein